MKKKRLITNEEKELIINSKIKSTWSLGVLFYIMTIILPLFINILITRYYHYFYILIVAIIVLLLVMWGYPIILKRYIRENDIYCFDSKVLSCRPGDVYYYLTEIEGLDNNFIDYKFPVSRRLKNETELIVVVLMEKKKYNYYYLIDKEKMELVTCKRTRFDLID